MDWMGNATAERALTGSDGGRWNYPDLWHTFTVPLSEAGENLQIIMVRRHLAGKRSDVCCDSDGRLRCAEKSVVAVYHLQPWALAATG